MMKFREAAFPFSGKPVLFWSKTGESIQILSVLDGFIQEANKSVLNP
jgi:hypothetical protein